MEFFDANEILLKRASRSVQRFGGFATFASWPLFAFSDFCAQTFLRIAVLVVLAVLSSVFAVLSAVLVAVLTNKDGNASFA
jgi:hypothetical protein